MRLYKMIIAIFGVSMFLAAVNAMGVFSTKAPEPGLTVDSTKITDLTNHETVESQGTLDALWGGMKLIGTSIKFLFEAIFALFKISGVMQSLGIPAPLIAYIIGMMTIISIFGLLFWLTNRNTKGME